MTTPTYPQIADAYRRKFFSRASTLAMSKQFGISQPTLWRWRDKGIPQTQRNIALLNKIIEEHGLIIHPEEMADQGE